MTPDAAADSPGEASKQIPSTAGMTTKVVKGSMWTLAGQVAPLAVSLVTTPFVIRMLGTEGYGVLILIGLIPTYLGFADFGMSMASTKFASEAYAEGDEEKEARIVRTAAFIALMSSVPVAVALMIFAGVIIDLFNVPPAYIAEATLALHLAAATFVINILCGIFNTPQLTRLRMDLNTIINAVPRILGLIATPIVIYLGYGVVGATAVLFVASTINLIGHLIVSRRLLHVMFGWSIETVIWWQVVQFGAALAFSSVAAALLVNVEKAVLPAIVSVSALAYYAVAFTLASLMTMFTTAMTQSLLPAFSRLQSESNRPQLEKLFSRAVRINFIWLIPALAFLAIIAKPFFTFWAGEDFGSQSVWPFRILLLGLTISILAWVPHTVLMASGRAGLFVKLYWSQLLPYVALVWLLTSRFGIVGTAAAWSTRVAVSGMLHFYFARRASGVSVVSSTLPPLFLASSVMFLPVVLNGVTDTPSVIVGLVFIVSLAVYGILIWKMMLEPDETDWFSQRLQKLMNNSTSISGLLRV